MYFKNKYSDISYLADEAENYIKIGFSAIKMKIGQGEELDVKCVKSVRNAIGENIVLMVDANHAYNSTRALRMANRIADYNIYWLEEPVPPEDIDGYLEVKHRSLIPIAGGEAEYTRFGFKELISRRAVDYVQPDTCSTGGISEALKIIALASAYNIQYMPHVWGSSIALAANLHLLAALPDFPLCLDPIEPMLEFDRTQNPFRTHLSLEPIEQTNGYVSVPMRPGLGIEVDEKIIKQYRIL
jgi:D-galactarolactone cycloisomerase